MKKQNIIILILLALLVFTFYKNSNKQHINNKLKKSIAIFSPMYHPSLDAEIRGFKDMFSQKGYYKKLKIKEYNANSEFDKIEQILETIYSQKPDILFVLTTPAAIAASKFCRKNKIPTIYGAVTDPLESKIIDNFEKNEHPITGISDRYPVKEQCLFFSDFFTNKKEQNIAILYTPTEANSQILSKETEKYLKENSIKSNRIAINNAGELALITENLIKNHTGIIVNGDNAIIERLTIVANICQKYKKPLFVGDPLSIKKGAIGSLGPDYYMMGKEAANKAIRILKGETTGNISSSYPNKFEYAINTKIAKDIEYEIPKKVWEKVPFWKSYNIK